MSVRYIFNTSGEYVAFFQKDYLFTPDCTYIGFIRKGNEVYSKDGSFVGYLTDDDRIVRNTTEAIRFRIFPPFAPLRPLQPLRPLKRLRMPKLPYPYADVFENGYPDFLSSSEFVDSNKFKHLIGAKIIANDGQFLGIISSDKYDSNSISNKYGNYGNKYSSTSIFNQYGNYGGKYSSLSPFNKYTSTPPKIMVNDQFIAYLTVNKYLGQTIDTNEFINWLLAIQ